MIDAELRTRVDRLERVARRERLLALGALVLVFATAQAPGATAPIVVSDATSTATLSASGLAVRTGSYTRTSVGIDSSGYPSLDISDKAGLLRESMYLFKDRPVLRQFDTTGKRRAELFLASDTQNGEFVIRDAGDVTRLGVFIGAKGLPEFAVYGSDAAARAYLATDNDGPYLVMKDVHGTTRAVIGQYSDGKFGVEVRNTAGTSVWSRP